MDQETINALHIPQRVVDWAVFCETQDLLNRERVFARDRKTPLAGKTVILIDDGVVTGSRMLAAVHAIRKKEAGRIVVAVPTGSTQGLARLRAVADQVVCLVEPKVFFSVSHWYESFDLVDDWEVCQILDRVVEKTSALEMA